MTAPKTPGWAEQRLAKLLKRRDLFRAARLEARTGVEAQAFDKDIANLTAKIERIADEMRATERAAE
jgi:hypothetical protein